MKKIILMSFLLITSCSNIDISKIQDNKKEIQTVNKINIPEVKERSNTSTIDGAKENNINDKTDKTDEIEKIEGKIIFVSSENAKDVEPNTLYFLDLETMNHKKIMSMIENETESTKTEVISYQISPDETKVFIQKNMINKKDNSILRKYFQVFYIKNNVFINLNIEKYVTSIKWFPDSEFLSIFSNDKSLNNSKIVVFDINKNTSIFEYNFDDKTYGYFILPEIKLRKNSNFTYFLLGPFYKKDDLVRHKLFKIYKNKVEVVNEFINFNLSSHNNIFNNELSSYYTYYEAKKGITVININTLEKKTFLYYDDYNELKNFVSDFIFRDIYLENNFLFSGEKSLGNNSREKIYSIFMFNTKTKELKKIEENNSDLGLVYVYIVSKNYISYLNKGKWDILNIKTFKKENNLSLFFINNIQKFNSIYESLRS
ncbi:MAG: hypothetical protein U0457_07800 [Candidatus Sericytochromatia bacterium]